MSLNVLVFTSLYPNNEWPHSGVFIKERMVTFAKLKGCRLKVVAPVPYYPPVKLGSRWRYSQVAHQELRDGIEVYHPRYIMTPKVGMSIYGLLMFLSVLQTVKRIQRTFDFDIIDSHFVYPDGMAAVLLGWFFKKPVVISARGSDINLYGRFPLIRRLLRWTLNRAEKVIAVCQALKDAMVELGVSQDKITVIPNGVDSAKFFPVPRQAARKTLGLPDKKIILSVGWLIPRKGFDVLIKALKQIMEKDSALDPFLVIVGEGPSRKDLEELISISGLQERVQLVGNIPHERLHLWYSAADLFCLASDREGWPNVLLESLACGTPAVATAVWGSPDIIVSEDLGLLTKRNESDMAATIRRALRKPWQSDAIEVYAKGHTWERVAAAVAEVFEAAMDGRTRRE